MALFSPQASVPRDRVAPRAIVRREYWVYLFSPSADGRTQPARILIQLAVVIYALIDLLKRKKVRGPLPLWVIGLILGIFSFPGGVIIACLYLFWGRRLEE